MNILTLALTGLRGSRLSHALNIAVLGLGLGTLTLLLLASGSMTERLLRDGRGIDLVVGAKGSPLQLVLSTVFQTDFPTGNIPISEAQSLAANPMIARAVPLALGDAAHGFRIVGTTPEYLDLYQARLAEGQIWHNPLDAVLGADAARVMQIGLGAHFLGAHGVLGNGELHSAYPYTVTGILAPTGRVIDRLILTPVESVWKVHESHQREAVADAEDIEAARAAAEKQVTAVLLQAHTPLALIALPYRINRSTPYEAAVPSQEWARLVSVLGFGFAAFRAIGLALVISASLAMLLALLARLRERRRDMAMLRLLGASRIQVFATVFIEAMFLALAGGAMGLLLGHAAAMAIAAGAPPGSALTALGAVPRASEWIIVAISVGIGAISALAALLATYRSDVATELSASVS